MVNTLQLRYETIMHTQAATSKLFREYVYLKNTYEYEELNDEIRLKIFGKNIRIPYYKTIYGNCINEKEIEAGASQIPKYDSYEYKSFTDDEIYDRIITAFDDSSLLE